MVACKFCAVIGQRRYIEGMSEGRSSHWCPGKVADAAQRAPEGTTARNVPQSLACKMCRMPLSFNEICLLCCLLSAFCIMPQVTLSEQAAEAGVAEAGAAELEAADVEAVEVEAVEVEAVQVDEAAEAEAAEVEAAKSSTS